jgi:hypothetical protein
VEDRHASEHPGAQPPTLTFHAQGSRSPGCERDSDLALALVACPGSAPLGFPFEVSKQPVRIATSLLARQLMREGPTVRQRASTSERIEEPTRPMVLRIVIETVTQGSDLKGKSSLVRQLGLGVPNAGTECHLVAPGRQGLDGDLRLHGHDWTGSSVVSVPGRNATSTEVGERYET